MTVGELKRALENVPDHAEVIVPTYKYIEGKHHSVPVEFNTEENDGYYVDSAKYHEPTAISNREFALTLGKGFEY